VSLFCDGRELHWLPYGSTDELHRILPRRVAKATGTYKLFLFYFVVEGSSLLSYYRRPMKKEHQQLIHQHIQEAFTAINKLSELITEKDLQWANKNYEDNDVAAELTNLAENLIDSGKQFYLYD
jgi:hypothetical protein